MFHPVRFGVGAALATIVSALLPSEALAGPTSVASASVVGLSAPIETVGYCANRHRRHRRAYYPVRRVYHYVYGSVAPVVTTTYGVYDDPYYDNYSYGSSYPYYSAWSTPIYWGGGYRRSWGGWGGGYRYRPFGGGWGGGYHRPWGGGWGGGYHRPWGGGWGGGIRPVGHWGGGGFGGGFHHGGGGHFGGFHHGGGWGGARFGGFGGGGGFRGGGFGFRGR